MPPLIRSRSEQERRILANFPWSGRTLAGPAGFRLPPATSLVMLYRLARMPPAQNSPRVGSEQRIGRRCRAFGGVLESPHEPRGHEQSIALRARLRTRAGPRGAGRRDAASHLHSMQQRVLRHARALRREALPHVPQRLTRELLRAQAAAFHSPPIFARICAAVPICAERSPSNECAERSARNRL